MFKNVKNLPAYNRLKTVRVLGETDKLTPSVEDFRFINDDTILLSSGDVMHFIDEGETASDKGSIYVVHLPTEKMRKLELKGYPGEAEEPELGFRPHGIDFSKRTNSLYVINHANNRQERVEIFSISNHHDFETVELRWTGVLKPNVPYGTLNSVTETSDKDVYVTQWLPTYVPKTGLDHPKSLADNWAFLKNYGSVLTGRALGMKPFRVGKTKVHRCHLETKESHVAFKGFVSCNGICSTPDGKIVFVVDCFRGFLAIFDRNHEENGKLTKRKVVEMPHLCDNVHLKALDDGTYELCFGSMPDFYANLMSAVKKDNRLNAGGCLIAVFNPENDDIKFDDVFIHDGSMLPATATSARWNGKVLLSGPRPKGGVLICE
jgi:hypothetical protein